MKIAFIDDGVYPGSSEKVMIPTIHNMVVQKNSVYEEVLDENVYISNHGTSCFCIYSDTLKRSDYDLYSISILDSSGKCDIDKLKVALFWCLKNEIKLISMSLGSTYFADFQFESVVASLYRNNVIIVAAYSNFNHFTFPASTKYAIGVRHDYSGLLKYGEFCFSESDVANIEITCHCEFRYLEEKVDYIYDEYCNSYSAPYIAALVHQGILDGYDTPTLAKQYLKERAIVSEDLQSFEYIKGGFREWINIADLPVVAIMLNGESGFEFALQLTEIFRSDEYNAVLIVSNYEMTALFDGLCFDLNKIQFAADMKDCLELLSNIALADLLIIQVDAVDVEILISLGLVSCIVVDSQEKIYTPTEKIFEFKPDANNADAYQVIKNYLLHN